ncbi:MAG: hypothetical protein K2X32_01225 [Phycisphaerales bacterium]|nr:hypothetical protein [Phycisphaerales bacterium]
MSSAIPASSSSRISAAKSVIGLLMAAGLATPALAQPWHWNTGDGNWNTAGNWVQLAPPPVTANVFIGNTAPAENGFVSLNVSPEIAGLNIPDGMTLFTNSHSLRVNGNTVVSGNNVLPDGTIRRADLRVGATDGVSFRTDRLTLADGGGLFFSNGSGGFATINDWVHVEADSFITGNGVLTFAGAGTTLVNNDSLSPGTGDGLRMQQIGAGRYDLDGTTGNGVLSLTTYNDATSTGGQMRLDGIGLADSFSGRILLGPSADLEMNLTEGWVADASSEIVSSLGGVVGGPFANNRSVIDSTALDFSGLLRAGFTSGEGRDIAVRASALTLRSAARVEVKPNSTVTLGSLVYPTEVLVEGGTFDVEPNASLIFYGATEVRGGVFTTTGTGSAEGFINFFGDTQWRGNVTINGTAHQSASATVAAPTVINAIEFDMDGTSGDTVWNVNNNLVVNAQRLDDFSSRFDGVLNITAGVAGRLTINLDDPSESWQMNGTMNLAGSGGLPVTRVAGSSMLVTGYLNVTSGIAQITADTAFSSNLFGAGVSIAQNATLRTRGHTVVGANTTFAGTGTFQNGVNGDLVLDSGVTLSQVGLINNSGLRIAAGAPGIASVDRFTSTADALWTVDIGGLVAGTQHDTLLVSGGDASLGGTLNVSLIGLGGGPAFSPSIGDQFTILFALGGVSGTFSNDPFTQVGALTYDWEVIYNSNTVVLRLDNIVPAPGSVGLLGLGGLLAARRRRA